MTTADERPQHEAAAAATTSERGALTPEQIQADIEKTRDDLGRTVEALSAKLDVKTRTKKRLSSAREQAEHRAVQARVEAAALTGRVVDAASDDEGRLRPAVPIAATVLVAAVALATVLSWKHRHR